MSVAGRHLGIFVDEFGRMKVALNNLGLVKFTRPIFFTTIEDGF
jgi:hypothetical protein